MNTQSQIQTLLEHKIAQQREQLLKHPIGGLIRTRTLPLDIAKRFAAIQYADSVLWVPMLALMKDQAQSPKLIQALRDNLLCEAGANHKSHVMLAREFIESLGVTQRFTETSTTTLRLLGSIARMTEAQIAGWILAAEALVPTLFTLFLPVFERIPGTDLTYLKEHIHVDSDEHAQWMMQAALEIIERDPQALEQVLQGIYMGSQDALEAPNALYFETIQSQRQQQPELLEAACF